MNAAVQQAIEARITAVDAEIQQTTEVLTTHVTTMTEAKAQVDTYTHALHVLELEKDELVAALPIEDEEPSE